MGITKQGGGNPTLSPAQIRAQYIASMQSPTVANAQAMAKAQAKAQGVAKYKANMSAEAKAKALQLAPKGLPTWAKRWAKAENMGLGPISAGFAANQVYTGQESVGGAAGSTIGGSAAFALSDKYITPKIKKGLTGLGAKLPKSGMLSRIAKPIAPKSFLTPPVANAAKAAKSTGLIGKATGYLGKSTGLLGKASGLIGKSARFMGGATPLGIIGSVASTGAALYLSGKGMDMGSKFGNKFAPIWKKKQEDTNSQAGMSGQYGQYDQYGRY